METVTQSIKIDAGEMAEVLGISPGRLLDLDNQGTLISEPDGMYLLVFNVRAYLRFIREKVK